MKIAGPTFVKLSQWAATRSDVFPPQFCAELSHLHSKNKPHKFIHTKKCIAETYGGIKDIEAIFEWIEEEPIGAGAIAQVHKAKLREEAVDYIVARSALYFGSVTDTSTGEAGENGIFVSTGPVSITLEDNSTARKEYTGQDSNSSVDTNAKQSTSNRPNLKLEVGQHCVLTKDDLVNLKETLKKNREVAIKVLHPDSEKLVLRDLKIMSFFAKTLCYIPTIKWLSLVEEVMVFGQMMKSQLNLREEASNLLVFSKNFSEQKGVRFPVPLLPITGKQVLVETYSDGVPVSVFMKNAGSEFDKIIASAGLDSFMRMMIWDNFTHADLHPGNILVSFVPPPPLSRSLRLFNKLTRKIDPKSFEPAILDSVEGKEFESIKKRIDLDNLPTESEVNRTVAELSKTKTELLAYLDQLYTLGYRPDLVYLDAGLVTVLNDVHRRNFLELFDAICSFDGERAGYAMIERCTSPELVVEPEIYAKKIEQMVENVRLNSLSLGKVSASSILNQTMDAVRQHRVKLDPNSVNLCVAILVVEGIGRKLYPDLDLLRASLPILRDFFRFEAQSRILNQQKNPPSMIPPPSGSEDSATSVFSGINLDMLKIWVYVEAREYFDRVVNWGSDEAEFFGPFAPALSFYF
ncbi:ABC1 family protein [Zancudomyces culisetae]|uniref:ABC1 family protein n=1 Tax=Zancudomyces culisetae TaxID=1213189 RepID=A0A1R1PNZ4_ZANCU|nr:ABC1 family protein [Zancudomyces culisetae]OMH82696.1 ABC1 family protein [Zancudomyces culisetae]|eukprot:OMH78923.1 ABC1 family protein [Zancudomyces culisetae]